MGTGEATTAKIVINGTNEEVGIFFACLKSTANSLRLMNPVEVRFAGNNYYITIKANEPEYTILSLKDAIENGVLGSWKDDFDFT